MNKAAGGARGWPAAARLLGLGVRARNVVIGVEGVRSAAQKGRVALAIIASDASRNSAEKMVPLLTARGVALVVGPDALALGSALGRSAVAAVGVLDNQLAAGITRAIETDPEKGQAEQGIE